MPVLRLPLTQEAGDEQTQSALDEMKRHVEYGRCYGTSAPDNTVTGSVYYQVGSGKTWIRIDGTWTEV